MQFIAMRIAMSGVWAVWDSLNRCVVTGYSSRQPAESDADALNEQHNENPIRDRAEQRRLLRRKA